MDSHERDSKNIESKGDSQTKTYLKDSKIINSNGRSVVNEKSGFYEAGQGNLSTTNNQSQAKASVANATNPNSQILSSKDKPFTQKTIPNTQKPKLLERCNWVYQGYNASDLATKKLYQDYHDFEWGIPQHEDRRLFEQLVLEGMQSGLSWITILKKRAALREAFDDFDPVKVAGYDVAKIESLMKNSKIIRNRAKIESAINNAKRFLEIQREFGSFDSFIWGYVGGKPIINAFKSLEEIPTRTELSDRIAKDLKKRGFSYVGSVGIYAYMQSIGLVCDHLVTCAFYYKSSV